MEERVYFVCPNCRYDIYFPIEEVEAHLSAVRIGKVSRVAHQLMLKRGPYYARWKAAMDARGEQKRCKECVHFYDGRFNPRYPITGMSCGRADRGGGEFACRHFHSKE